MDHTHRPPGFHPEDAYDPRTVRIELHLKGISDESMVVAHALGNHFDFKADPPDHLLPAAVHESIANDYIVAFCTECGLRDQNSRACRGSHAFPSTGVFSGRGPGKP